MIGLFLYIPVRYLTCCVLRIISVGSSEKYVRTVCIFSQRSVTALWISYLTSFLLPYANFIVYNAVRESMLQLLSKLLIEREIKIREFTGILYNGIRTKRTAVISFAFLPSNVLPILSRK